MLAASWPQLSVPSSCPQPHSPAHLRPCLVQNIYSVAWSPSGEYLATGSFDGQVYIWAMRAGTLARAFKVGGVGEKPMGLVWGSGLLPAAGLGGMGGLARRLAPIDTTHPPPICRALAAASTSWDGAPTAACWRPASRASS